MVSWSGNTNRCAANECLTYQGSAWLYALFCVFAFTAFGLLFLSHGRPLGHRAFHFIATAILLITALTYWIMASNLGYAVIGTEFSRGGTLGGPTRAIFYARYIDWVLTTPLLLLLLLLGTGFSLSRIFFVLFIDVFMIICGLIGALTASRYKWGLFSFGVAAAFYIWWTLIHPGRASAFRLGNDYGKAYSGSAIFLLIIWFIYPIIWAVSDGGNVIPITSEMIAVSLLTILALPVPSVLYHLYRIEGLEYDRFGFVSGKYTDDPAYAGAHPRSDVAMAQSGAGVPQPSVPAQAPAAGGTGGATLPAGQTTARSDLGSGRRWGRKHPKGEEAGISPPASPTAAAAPAEVGGGPAAGLPAGAGGGGAPPDASPDASVETPPRRPGSPGLVGSA
ncbi:hypothetical protein JCM5296_001299 [Sporobolomyces johnsonii]